MAVTGKDIWSENFAPLLLLSEQLRLTPPRSGLVGLGIQIRHILLGIGQQVVKISHHFVAMRCTLILLTLVILMENMFYTLKTLPLMDKRSIRLINLIGLAPTTASTLFKD